MAEKIVFGIDIETGKAAQSFSGMKAELKALSKALGEIEEGSNAFEVATQRAGLLKEKIRGVNDAIENADPEKKFAPFSRTIQGLAGGFAAAQGAMALFGGESKDLEKTLIKVQGAMALSQGLNSLLEFKNDFIDLGKAISGPVIKAFTGLRSAIIATGIGALVVLVGTLIVYWEEIAKAINGVNSSEKELLKTQEKRAENAQKNLDVLNAQENILKLQGKSEKEILQLKIKAVGAAIQEQEIVLGTQKSQVKAQVEAAERNKQILKGLIQFISLPLTAILQTVDQVGNFLGKDWNTVESVFGNISEMMFNPEETKQKAEESINESEKALAKLKNDYAGYQLGIIDIDKKAEDEKIKLRKDAADKEAANKKSNDEYAKLADATFTKEMYAQMEKQIADKKFMNDTIAQWERQGFEDSMKQYDAIQASNKAAMETDEAKKNAQLNNLAQVNQALNGFASLLGQQTIAGKALAIATTTIDTYVASFRAYKEGLKLDPTGTFSIIAAAAAAATGIASIRKIVSVQVPGGGGGGGSMPSAAQASVPQFNPAVAQQVQGGGDVQLGMKPQKVYVVESDIRGSMNKVDVIQSNAKIG